MGKSTTLFIWILFLTFLHLGHPKSFPKEKREIAESSVRISIGEQPDFFYEVHGFTYSFSQIDASGKYYNNEVEREGFANLFLGAQPDIFYYEFAPNGNQLQVYVLNSYNDEFYFNILVPPAVSVTNDLCIRQINQTCLLVEGPSRSASYSPCFLPYVKSEGVHG